jgi:hypothetical protein
MESAPIARWCQRQQIPFGCVRAVSDDAATVISDRLVSALAAASNSPWRSYVLPVRHPGLLPELWRLARQTRFASLQLAKALGELLTLTLPWANEGEQ